MHSLPMFRLDGKVAVITGATRGIGLATARLLGAAGARLAISSRKQDACAATCASLRAEGIEVVSAAGHVGHDEDRRRLIDTAMQTWGQLDIVVANAAVNPVFAPLEMLAPEMWDKIIDTNLTSPWRLSQLALPLIAQQGGGTMVMLSSLAGLVAAPGSGAYAVSKAGENHLARQLAAEWGPRGVRVNVVAPGTTRTDMIRALSAVPGALDATIAATPLRRIGEPENIAATILFLVSDAGRHLTGQVLVVDGGHSLAATP